jgi:DNA invertase Pin-like site-specific DNA recombinase
MRYGKGAKAMKSAKVQSDHLGRRAYIYVRQSTYFQVVHNCESTERQYNLRQRALDLGWSPQTIEVIDEDQGQSASSAEHRVGFQRLASEIGVGQVGIVLMLEASRVARSCSDWHRLIEICSVTRTLIGDEAGVYDPREPNDRLLLGVKGTLSEAELFTLRTRLYEGRWNKARKGQLGRSVPTGYVKGHGGGWIKDPDQHVQERLTYVFDLFRRHKVARRALCELRQEGLKLPARVWGGPRNGQLDWKDATLGALMRILNNPAYAGAYVYGRCEYDASRRYRKTGKARPKLRTVDQWPVCLVSHHEAYLSWDEFRQNQRRLRQNWFRSMTRGAAREGTALLQGIAWCGRCGARMQVNSYSVKERRKPSYICTYRYSQEGDGRVCQGMSSTPIDEVVVAAFLDAMQPAQLAVSAKVIDQLEKEKDALKRQWEKQLAQARYEAQLAQRQYDAVDPDNRAVAQTLERRWNEKLEALERLEKAFAEAEEQERFQLTAEERGRIGALAQDLPKVWTAATTTDRERKELLRHAISEVQLDGVGNPGKIEIRITWRSGAVTVRTIDRLPVGSWAPRTAETVVERIRELAPDLSAHEIASRLDQEGLRSAHGKSLREHHVLYICRSRGIPVRCSRTQANQLERSHLH